MDKETAKELYEVLSRGEFPMPRLIKAVKKAAEGEDEFKRGFRAGLSAYAWWKDGVEYVGTCGTTLKEALRAVGT